MEVGRFVWVLLLVWFGLCLFGTGTHGYRYHVGGRDGWVAAPAEDYNHWAQRTRFHVNDTLFFKYPKESDSVLFVSKDDYFKCNTQNPIVKMEGGDSEFSFYRSGSFYFISGQYGNCGKGQKLLVVVMGMSHRPRPTTAPVSPQGPPLQPPAGPVSPTTPSPSPVGPAYPIPQPPPTSPVPAPSTGTGAPTTSPGPAPKSAAPTPGSGGDAASPAQGSSGGGGSGDSPAPGPSGSRGVTAPSSVLVCGLVFVSVALLNSFVQGGAL